jgi:hypothetical protein
MSNLTQQDFIDACILYLSGVAKMYNEREIELEDEYHRYNYVLTVEFPTSTPTYVIERTYHSNGQLRSKAKHLRTDL